MLLLFKILLFFIPLILFPTTSELFEFNKMVATYILTVLIVSLWVAKMISQRKIIFRRTILDIPLLIFLSTQIISTLISLDPRTSLFGYYSRFNGGLLSSFTYALLYWAWVSNLDAKKTVSSLKFLLMSAVLVSLYGILEHFGIDKNIWVQDVAERVFSTLGQPNWLAAWLVALIPISWAFALKEKLDIRNRKLWIWTLVSLIFFITILFTKSRSGLLGFGAALVIFWGPNLRKKWKKALFLILPLAICALVIGTPWTRQLPSSPQGTSLETGGTESGKIREIVWKGALEIWKHYPLFGSGVETFAYSYYNFRPIEHNLVSEWDFLYNKAHNEYLNFMATTGTLGIVSYLALIIFSLLLIFKSKSDFKFAFLGGYGALLVTNFFGFSVVPTSLLFFLFPAFAVTLSQGRSEGKVQSMQMAKSNNEQKILLAILLIVTGYLLIVIARYWYADLLYAKGKALNDQGTFVNGRQELVKAVSFSPREPVFWDELSQSSTGIAVSLQEAAEKQKAQEFADVAIKESQKATGLSPKNVNLKRNRATLFIKLSALDAHYLTKAIEAINEAIDLAPTDAKLVYNLGLTYLRTGNTDKALESFEKAIAMKPNYRDARLALALVFIDKGQKPQAKEELNYILKRIDPNDELVKQQLDGLQ